MTTKSTRVAVIGGGISGSCAANRLTSLFNGNPEVDVVLFDQGGRGPGGRASHRRVRKSDGRVLPDDVPLESSEAQDTFQFDHGCQFFCAGDDRFRTKVSEWYDAEVVQEWKKRCVLVTNARGIETCRSIDHTGGKDPTDISHKDFFGILSSNDCYVGVGGMQKVSRFEASSAVQKGATLMSGVRVSKISGIKNVQKLTVANTNFDHTIDTDSDPMEDRKESDSKLAPKEKWELFGTNGAAALHDTAESHAAASVHYSLGTFDAVIVTDASCSFEGWHRASAGISAVKPEFAAYIKSRARIPLFTTMVAFDRKVFDSIDSAVFDLNDEIDQGNEGDEGGKPTVRDGLWFAARCTSKPGFQGSESLDCWTLVSTPKFAVSEISETTMQDDVGVKKGDSGTKITVFKPQENEYLNEGPALSLVNTFLYRMRRALNRKNDTTTETGDSPHPVALYLQGQRWGSALPGDFLPLDLNLSESTKFKNVEGVIYQSEIPDLNVLDNLNSPKGQIHENERISKVDARIEPLESNRNDVKDFLYDDYLGLYYAGDFCSKRTAGVEAAALSGIDVANHVYSQLKL